MSLPIIRSLVAAALAAPSADNSQPFCYRWDGRRLTMEYDAERVGGLTFGPGEAATLLSAGAAMENIDISARHCEIAARWDLSPIRATNNPIVAVLDLASLPQQLSETTQLPLFDRHTNRLPYLKKPIPPSVLQQLESQSGATAHVSVMTAPDTLKTGAQLVRSASEIRFQTREVHEWLGQSLRFSADEANCGDGLDCATLHLPPGGKSFLKLISDWRWMARLNKIGAYRILAAMDSKPVGDASALIGIVGGPEPEEIIDAGRLMERVWIQLNAEGIAVQPYYVISDQLQREQQGKIPASLRAQAQQLKSGTQQAFRLPDDAALYMLFRIGYPNHDAVRSKRIAFDRCFRTDDAAS